MNLLGTISFEHTVNMDPTLHYILRLHEYFYKLQYQNGDDNIIYAGLISLYYYIVSKPQALNKIKTYLASHEKHLIDLEDEWNFLQHIKL